MTDIDNDKIEDHKLQALLEGAGRREPLPEDVRARLEDTFRSELANTRARRSTIRLGAIGSLAASVLVAVFLFTGSTEPPPRPQVATINKESGGATWQFATESGPLREGTSIQTGDILATGPGTLSLSPSGAAVDVRLAKMSELTFLDANTIALNRGSIYVDADPASPHFPLTIMADKLSVSHLGTQYMISRDNDQVEVAVREGQIGITTPAEILNRKANNGEGLLTVFSANVMIHETSVVAFDNRWAWAAEMSPSIETDQLPLTDFFSWVSHQTGYDVSYNNVALTREDVIKGSIETTHAMDALNEAISLTPYAAEVQSNSGRIIITERNLETPD